MTEEPEDLPEALSDAHRAATNSALLTVVTLAFGFIALSGLEQIPTWIVSVWFVLVIPLNLYLMFMNRRRYRTLREMHDHDGPIPPAG
ncbi:fatty acid desaturase [Conyzicola lurida]|uniref:Fatty acid desaturase n=1 Tax=Conyzicola lurida TaxID=1172621 RepID=A0A841AML6_9MICO|nr:hypothetical protein [Conyzicola lurida]MBB5843574.1 fatty acid desaturase [Conyzicola lurida]